MIASIFRKDRAQSQAETLYAALAGQARAPEFYAIAGAPDTPEGRFDMLALHMFLAIDRLRGEGAKEGRLIRRLQEIFFESLDGALREMGVGDLSVGRKIRGLAEAFYGRFSAYERAIGEAEEALEAALSRNVIGTEDASAGRMLARYVRGARAALEETPADDLASAFARLSAISSELVARAR